MKRLGIDSLSLSLRNSAFADFYPALAEGFYPKHSSYLLKVFNYLIIYLFNNFLPKADPPPAETNIPDVSGERRKDGKEKICSFV
ncbi:MAG: hypothetical protein HY769_02650 [Candidatus Stahlbacteria bacterium]|nr:hypothetical protein [Candidatus Stahlbacteria bacterium]